MKCDTSFLRLHLLHNFTTRRHSSDTRVFQKIRLIEFSDDLGLSSDYVIGIRAYHNTCICFEDKKNAKKVDSFLKRYNNYTKLKSVGKLQKKERL